MNRLLHFKLVGKFGLCLGGKITELALWTLDQATLPMHGFPSPFGESTKCDPKEDADGACMLFVQHTNIRFLALIKIMQLITSSKPHITFTGDLLVS